MTSSQIRQSFLDFFAARGHSIVPSSPLLPDSPGLLFTNAGMNQFVPIFLGERPPDVSRWAGARPGSDTRAADTQKCIRAGGKHNDLEDVGLDTYHHTFFEMLGNWSFGDYFKKESIAWGWDLVAGTWGVPPKRIFATVYSPDNAKGDPSDFDQEAHDIWAGVFRGAGLDPEVHIVRGAKKDNFWMMGETGPCGPCSEISINLLPSDDEDMGRRLVNAGSPRCIEIWNHVFIQFNANADGTFSPLAAKHVDTGMGFERVAGIFATTKGFTDFSAEPSNYDCDVFAPLFSRIAKLSGRAYMGTVPKGRSGHSGQEQTDVAFRVLADHARCVSCAIADGILPANEGRGYVIRRILRRAALYGRQLGLATGFFEELVAPVVESLGEVFPDLKRQESTLRRVIRSEEEGFGRALERGLKRFDEAASAGSLPGPAAFELYDTYGFPLDLTQLIARERGLTVDAAGFEALMDRQRERGRAAQKKEVIVAATKSGGPASQAPTAFTGYSLDPSKGAHATLVDVAKSENGLFLVFDRTPFYAEMGGQQGDSGHALIAGRALEIVDTVRDKSGRHLHRIAPESVFPAPGAQAELSVDPVRRRAIQRHHTATHLLHWALRKVLGTHVRQAGSLNGHDRLRFDFSHFEAVTHAQLREIEEIVNQRVLDNAKVEAYEVDFDRRPEGTLAFFGEKYGKVVRVVDIGGFSRELCAGTHVASTGEIGFVKIVHEGAIAAGTRRVEAVAGDAAYRYALRAFDTLEFAAQRLGSSRDALEGRIESLLAEKSDAERRLRSLEQRASANLAEDIAGRAVARGSFKYAIAQVSVDSTDALRSLGSQVLGRLGGGVVVLAAVLGDKAAVSAFCAPDAVAAGHNAGKIVNEISKTLGGKGGGKPDFAMGGGRDIGRIQEALSSSLPKV
ncbi:MAG TPA: alanine--tRNA ligase [Opitutaceae bacterium]|nr:alanine--tRNA ligase [Opitutaceae bacterium]